MSNDEKRSLRLLCYSRDVLQIFKSFNGILPLTYVHECSSSISKRNLNFFFQNSYFNKRSPKIGRKTEQYDNAGMVMDEDLEKKDFVAMTSHRIDPHSVPPNHRRSRAASYTPGKGTNHTGAMPKVVCVCLWKESILRKIWGMSNFLNIC
jgi:hypothetical protein